MESFALAIVILFMIFGIIGSIVPIMPGAVVTGAAGFAYAWATDFQIISLPLALFFVALAAFGTTADAWMPLLGAKQTGASFKTILFGIAGSIIGFFLGSFLPIFGNLLGSIVGYIVGLVLGEYQRLGDWNKAIHAGIGGLVGWGLATVVQFLCALLILILFVAGVWLW